jgi:hypothetical protein
MIHVDSMPAGGPGKKFKKNSKNPKVPKTPAVKEPDNRQSGRSFIVLVAT